MALSLTRIQFLGLALILIAGVTTAFGQDYWSEQKPMSCHPKLLSSVHGGIFQPQVKQYEWQGRVTNTYDQTVTFDMYMKVGNQKKSIGRFTVEAGKSTNATSLYYDDPSKLLEISVDNVCFLKGGCKKTCYAGCDDGRSINQPSCDDQPTSPTSNQNQNPANNSGAANSAEGIKQRIVENLRANIRPVKMPDNVGYMNYSDIVINTNGAAITIKYRVQNERGSSQDFTDTIPFTNLAQDPRYPLQGPHFVYNYRTAYPDSRFQFLTGIGAGMSLPYDTGPNDQNFNELKALAAELAGATSTPQGTSAGAEAVKQKIFQNLKDNARATTLMEGNNDHVYSDIDISRDGNVVVIKYKHVTNGLCGAPKCLEETPAIPFQDFAYGALVDRTRGQVKCLRTRGFDLYIAYCMPYDAGPNDENFNELKALAAQLAGAPSSTQNSSSGTNNSSGNSSVPTNTGSSSPGSKKEAPETIPKAAYDIMVAGDQQYNAKNYAAALESYKRAAEIVPNSPTVNFYLGDAYAMSAKHTEAAAAYQKAIENRPNYVAAYTALANNLDRLNRKDEAIEWLKKGVRAVPDNAQLWYNLGDRVSRASASGVDGLAFLQKSVELDPKCMDCQSSIADAFAKLEQWDAAVRSYEIVFQLDPGDGRLMPYGPLMNAYNKVGKYGEAVRKYLNLEAHADPSYNRQMSNFVHLQLGIAYCGLKDKPKAMAALARLKSCPTCSNMESEELLQKIKETWPTKPKGRK